MNRDNYLSPFSTRYAGKEMQYIFSEDFKFSTWHRLWIALAKAEQKLGLDISDAQIAEMEQNADIIDYPTAQALEKELRHDVMAHVHAFAKQCPLAAPIIHLGATSCYVGDNTDLIIMRKAADILLAKMISIVRNLSDFALEHKDLACLAYTHLQPAQPTTIGKRATLWIYELMLDIEELARFKDNLALLGSQGTTGTQASFRELLNDDRAKIKQLNQLIAAEMGFDKVVPVSGQTYSRKVDSFMLNILSGIAQSASKFGHDLRILQSFEEMEEPFGKKQIGSSAMPYKRNPMKSERICSLARYVISDSLNPAFTAATQWFERSLDDSANKRIAVAEAFLGVDAILNLYLEVSDGLVVYPKIVGGRLQAKLPFMATENILMKAVKKGADRQIIHEALRKHSQATAAAIKLEGAPNDLLERIAADPQIPLDSSELAELMHPALYIGLAPEQVVEFIEAEVKPLLVAFDSYRADFVPSL